MRVLITGVTGFVGSNLLYSIDAKYAIYGLVRRNLTENESNGFNSINVGDFSATTNYGSHFSSEDIVVHLAALVHQPSQKDESAYMRVNYEATMSMARQALSAGVKKFIFLSTSHIYGKGTDTPYVESDSLDPDTPYARSKARAEIELQALFKNTATKLFIIRPPLIYGKGVKGNLASISKLISKAPMIPFGSANQQRSYVSIENLCGFIKFLIESDNAIPGVYNISDDFDLSTRDLCRYISQAQNRKCLNLKFSKIIMRPLFSLVGMSDQYKKIYSSMRLSCEKAKAAGWKPKKIEAKDFII